jgi:hypothetical protein
MVEDVAINPSWIKLTRMLLEHGLDINTLLAFPYFRGTPMMVMALDGKWKGVDSLLQLGANITLKDKEGLDIIAYCVKYKKGDVGTKKGKAPRKSINLIKKLILMKRYGKRWLKILPLEKDECHHWLHLHQSQPTLVMNIWLDFSKTSPMKMTEKSRGGCKKHLCSSFQYSTFNQKESGSWSNSSYEY